MPVSVSRHGDKQRAVIRGQFRGWLPDYPPDELPPDAFSDVQNVEVLRGRVRKMRGYNEWHEGIAQLQNADASAAVPRALANYEQYDGTLYGVVISDKRAWKSNGDTWSLLTAASLTGGESVSWTTMDDILIWTNGVDAPRKWDGGANDAALGGSPVVCDIVCHWDDRLWLASTTEGGGTKYAYRLWFSEVGDPEDWTGSNTIDLLSVTDPPQFGGIKAVAPMGQQLLIYLENAIWSVTRLTDAPYYQARPIVEGVGAVNHRAVCVVPEGHIFVGPTDVYYWNGAGAAVSVTKGIRSHLQARLAPAFYDKVQAVWMKEQDKVLVGISANGVAMDTLYVLDRREGQWSLMDGVAFSALGYLTNTDEVTWENFPGPGELATNYDGDLIEWVEDTDPDNSYASDIVDLTWDDFTDTQFTRFAAGHHTGYVYVLYNPDGEETGPEVEYNRAGAAYTGKVVFGYQDFGRPDTVKRLLRIMPLNLQQGETDSLQLYIGTCDNPYQTPTWDGPHAFPMDTTTEPWLFVDVRGRYLVFRVETTASDAPWSLSGLVVDFVLQGGS